MPAQRGEADTSTSHPAAHKVKLKLVRAGRKSMKKAIAKILPWVLTCFALWIAFRGIDWGALVSHIASADLSWISLAIACTALSYILRSARWQGLFPERVLNFTDSYKILVLGFFMNNILPARAGEFVRAHMGAKAARQKGTLVLATIASERLLDGLTLSLMFAAFSFSMHDDELSKDFLIVAWIFLAAGLGVAAVIGCRKYIFKLTERLAVKFNNRALNYSHDRIHVFIEGLSPICAWRKLPGIVLWSIIIWSVELVVYWAVSRGYNVELNLGQCAIFMVAVNFSSLIPAAPGGIGVIEAVGSSVLVSFGIPKEQALTLVLTQHAIQYLVIGIPGALFMAGSKAVLKEIELTESK